MSGATYRIDVSHNPAEGHNAQWCAVVVRLSDNYPGTVYLRPTAESAVRDARKWIADQHAQQEPFAVYVDDEGQDADAPHSVKA